VCELMIRIRSSRRLRLRCGRPAAAADAAAASSRAVGADEAVVGHESAAFLARQGSMKFLGIMIAVPSSRGTAVI
jgi:hypothetical protein